MARRNAREKARRRVQQQSMTDRFRSIMKVRSLYAAAAVSEYARARVRGAYVAARDVRATLTDLFATMRVVSLEDAYKAHQAKHGITDPLFAQAEVNAFHAAAFAAWLSVPGNNVWHTVTDHGLTASDTVDGTDKKAVLACISGPGRPTGGWRLMVRKNDPVWIASQNRHEQQANGHGKVLQKAIDDAVSLGLLDAPSAPVPQLAPITP